MQTQHPRRVHGIVDPKKQTPEGFKQTPISELEIGFNTICNNMHLTLLILSTLGSKRTISIQLGVGCYNQKLPPYPMWDVTNKSPWKHNILVVSHRITGSNRQTSPTRQNKQTPHTGPNRHSHQGWRSTLILLVTTRTELYKYCPL